MILSDVCFTDNDFIGSGVIVVEGSIDDLTSSNVFGTVDPALKCPYASIGLVSCVDYDRDTCSASNSFYPTIEDKASDCFHIKTKLSMVLFFASVILSL